MPTPLTHWHTFLRYKQELEARQQPVRDRLKALVEDELLRQLDLEQEHLARQQEQFELFRISLQEDARFLLATEEFHLWFSTLKTPRDYLPQGQSSTKDYSTWELVQQPLPLGLVSIKHRNDEGYNDEQTYVAELLSVECMWGNDPFVIEFESQRNFIAQDPTLVPLWEQIEYPHIDDSWQFAFHAEDSPHCSSKATWDSLVENGSEDLKRQVHILARYAVSMLEVVPSEPSFRYP
jgi:hypothetical protein